MQQKIEGKVNYFYILLHIHFNNFNPIYKD